MLRINDEAPNFTAETSQGSITFHEWLGDGWGILFSHPKDFTPVCTTELGYMAGLQPEFAKRNCKIIGLSVDPVASHTKWAVDIEETHTSLPMTTGSRLRIQASSPIQTSSPMTSFQGQWIRTRCLISTPEPT